jgi:hypothetical protein
MIVILKRFPFDDVPVRLVKTWDDAADYCNRNRFRYKATKKEQHTVKCDIDKFAIGYIAIEFDESGKPTKSELYDIYNLTLPL